MDPSVLYGPPALEPRAFAEAFPYFVEVDAALTVRSIGPRVSRVCPALRVGDRLTDRVVVVHPAHETPLARVITDSNALVVVETPLGVRLRGSFVAQQSRETFVALWSPWVSHLAHLEQLGLGIDDFPMHTAVPDLLHLLQVQQQSLEDLSRLTARLSEQRRELRTRMTEAAEARRVAEEAARARVSFLANISHELRTPMNALLGMTRLLESTPLTLEQREYVETARTSGASLLAIINQLLDYAKLDSAQGCLEPAQFDLRACVEDAVELVAHDALARGLRFDYELIDDDAPGGPTHTDDTRAALFGDAGRLRQVLLNLLANAVKFTEAGSVRLTVRTRLEGDAPLLEARVDDTGPGIAPAVQARLFAPFVQGDNSASRRHGGTGLGLAISRRIVELMGGTLQCESVEGKGSSFIVRVPIARGTRVGDDETKMPGVTLCAWGVQRERVAVIAHYARRWGVELRVFDTAAQLEQALSLDRTLGARAVLLYEVEASRERVTVAPRFARRIAVSAVAQGPDASPSVITLRGPFRGSALEAAIARVLEGVPQGERRAVETPAQTKRLRVLVGEDHPVNQRVVTLFLRQLGYHADVVANGVEVLEAFERQCYDVVLMDVQMPELDGLEATRRLRARCGLSCPKVIAMTASALPTERAQCFDAGMDDFLAKPLELDALRRVLASLERSCSSRPPGRARAPEASSPSEAEPCPPCLDPRAFDAFASWGTERDAFVRGLCAIFVADALRQREALARARDAGDVSELRRYAHALKGGAATIGAARLAQRAEALERGCFAGDCSLDERVTALLEALAGTLEALEAQGYLSAP